MANLNKKISDTAVRLGPCRFSYVHVFERRHNVDGSAGKYEVSCIIPKTDNETVKLFNDAFNAAVQLGISTKWGGRKPAALNGGLRDGDDKDDPAYKNCWFFNAKSDRAPGVRVRENGVVCEALDADDIYSGC